ncbi:MAG: FAD-dependent oxidoreductase [Acidobacteria bacterium]|nr:FAD-dependent oxidoreductase [Acidobacteriota bacterium]
MTVVDTTTNADLGAQRHVNVLVDRCAGCQECVIRCPSGALSMEPVTWTALANDDACVGCRQCERTCPFSAIEVHGPLAVTARFDPANYQPVELRGNITETRRGYATWDEAVAEANRCLSCPDPTCVRGCPAHNDIPQFVAAVRERDLERAHEILSRTTVMPDICSRVCNQSAQCEGACTWSLAGGEPVAIGRLERFIADHAPVPAPSVVASTGDAVSVAIIGSGPAGIGAAWDLVEAGASVTVYERDATPGGLPIWGMPDFTLPDDVATRPWRQLIDAGVDLRCDTPIAPESIDDLLEEHDAVIVAAGAGMPIRLPVPGAELGGVVDATYFLKGAKSALSDGGDPVAFRSELGVRSERGQRVLVLGAGNTAMDVARMARRLGLEATCVDWLDERFALARPDELAEARHEGVEVRFSRTLTMLMGYEGRVGRALLAHTFQRDAKKSPVVLEREPDQLDVDLVVMAMGYRIDASLLESVGGLPIRKRATGMAHGAWSASGILKNPASAYNHHSPVGSLALDREVGLWAATMPLRERLWVAGDALTGPASVVEAMAQGRRAARALLDAHPTRPGRSREFAQSTAPRILVCYCSEGGTTKGVAEEMVDRLNLQGARAQARSINEVGVRELAEADALMVGTWVEGLVVAKVRPARAMREWLAGLPNLGGRRVGVFCTYKVNPRGALAEMSAALAAKGANVIASDAFGARDAHASIHPTKPEALANRMADRVVHNKASLATH